jgi:hypothetical protein
MSESLASEIEQAFVSEPIRRPTTVSDTQLDDEGTTETFLGTSWQDHSPKDIEQFTHSLSYFTPAAFAYFLPSFMLAALHLSSPGVLDALLFRLLPPKGNTSRPSFVAWWSLLSIRQRNSVVAFLEYFSIRELDTLLPAVRALRDGR